MNWRTGRYFVPPTDIIELTDHLIVMIEIAGMSSDAFSITLVNRSLIVSGVRHREVSEFTTYHQLEIGYGYFRVEVSLPFTPDPEQIDATYRDGLLEVKLPRRAEKHIHVGAKEGLDSTNE